MSEQKPVPLFVKLYAVAVAVFLGVPTAFLLLVSAGPHDYSNCIDNCDLATSIMAALLPYFAIPLLAATTPLVVYFLRRMSAAERALARDAEAWRAVEGRD